ncbi:MAG: tRNA pseudouridine(38-40) synthase TruA, partial [Myxococcota bacterium]
FHFHLDIERIKEGIEYLNGIKDFSAFKASDNECRGEVREIRINLSYEEPSLYLFTFRGRAFYKNMIRIIMGTLLRLGRGDVDIEGFKEIVESGDRRKAFETAPACGLILRRVIYEPDIDWGL